MDTTLNISVLQCVTFNLALTQMAVDILDIREIIRSIRITPVHKAPQFVAGLINLRGQILTILDIGVMLGGEKCRISKESHVIVFKKKPVGFLTDRIGDVVDVRPEDIDALPVNMDEKSAAVADRVLRLEDQTAMLVNSKNILSHTLFQQPISRDRADEF